MSEPMKRSSARWSFYQLKKNQPKVKDSKGLLLFSEEEEDFDKNSRQDRSTKLCLFQTGESEKLMDVQQV